MSEPMVLNTIIRNWTWCVYSYNIIIYHNSDRNWCRYLQIQWKILYSIMLLKWWTALTLKKNGLLEKKKSLQQLIIMQKNSTGNHRTWLINQIMMISKKHDKTKSMKHYQISNHNIQRPRQNQWAWNISKHQSKEKARI